MRLKQYTLANTLTIHDGNKLVASIYDAISAVCFCKYYSSGRLVIKYGGRKLDHYTKLKLVYGDIKDILPEVKKYETFGLFAQEKQGEGYIVIPDDECLEYVGDVFNDIKDFVFDLVGEYIVDGDDFNHQLEEILQYGLYNDQEFSKLVSYYSKMFFNETLSEQQSASVDYGEKKLNLSLAEADDIPEWLIDYIEQKELGFDFDTGNLRKIIGFQPMGWQRYFLVSQKRFSTIVGSRKLGKSFLMSYILIRQMFKKNQDIVYVVPNFDMADQVWSYVERFIRDINDPGLRFDKARRTFAYTTNRSICTFVSADSKSMGRSKKADLAIYDEGSFVSDIARKTLIPLVANTKGYEVYASTVSIETPINWFYKQFKTGELKLDPDYFSVRVDIYNNPFIDDDEKQRLIKLYADDALMSATELFAMFPSVGGGFNIAEFFIHHTNTKDIIINGITFRLKGDFDELKKEYYRFVLGYDPAMMRDKGGLVIVGVRKVKELVDGKSTEINVYEIVGGAYINVIDYTHQINTILELQEALKVIREGFVNECHIAMDSTGSGMGVYELMVGMGVKNVHRIMRGGSNFLEPTYTDGMWKCNKMDLESIFRAAAGKRLFAYNYLSELRSEIEEYGVSTRSRGDGHFDQLSAGFCAYFICKRYIGDYVGETLKIPKTGEDMYDHLSELYNQNIKKSHNIYNEEMNTQGMQKGRFGGFRKFGY